MEAELVTTKAVQDSGVSSTFINVSKADLVGLANGHTVFVMAAQYAQDVKTWTVPSGFTQLVHGWTAGHDGQFVLAYKTITDLASEPATWVFDNAYDVNKVAAVAVFSGLLASDLLDAAIVLGSAEDVVNPNAPDITTATAGALVLTVMSVSQNVTTAWTPVWGAPALYDMAVGAHNFADRLASAAIAYAVAGSAGLQSPGIWTNTGINAAYESGYGTIAFKVDPASAGRPSKTAKTMQPGMAILTGA